MSAAGGTGNLSAGALSIPVTYDASALAAQAKKMEAQAEAQGNRIATAERRGRQRAQAQANRISRVQGSVGGADDFAGNMPTGMTKAGGAATKMADGMGRSIIQVGALAAAGRVLNQSMDAVANAMQQVREGTMSTGEAWQQAGKDIASSIPIFGQFFQAGVKLREMIDGTAQALYDEQLALKAHNERLKEANRLNQEAAEKIRLARQEEERRVKALEDAAQAERDQQMSIVLALEAEYDKIMLTEEELLTKRLKSLNANQAMIDLAQQQLAKNNAALEQKQKELELIEQAAQAEREAADKREQAKQEGADLISALEKQLAIAKGLGDEYERAEMAARGISEADIKRMDQLKGEIAEIEKAKEELMDLESKRFREVQTGVMEVDRRRTAFGAPTGGGKMEVEDKGVAKRIGELVNKIDGLVLQ